jgi:hypothetical protein
VTVDTSRHRAPGRDRSHVVPSRGHRINLRYDELEFAAVSAAARRVDLTPSGYAALATLAAATDGTPPLPEPMREALAELMAARTQVRRFGVNVNQAVRELNATGTAPEWLDRAVELTARAVARLDAAAEAVAWGLR